MRALALSLPLLLACEPGKTTIVLTNEDSGLAGSDDSGDDGGGDSDPVEGVEDLPPTAVITGDTEGEIGGTFVLDGSGSSDPQGYALTDYAWTCSDGTVADGATVELVFDAAGSRTCALQVTSSSGLSGTASADLLVRPGKAQWTVIVYMNGDNDLEEWALGDLNELEQVGSTDQVNVIVQLDRSEDYTRADGDWDGARRYRVEADDDAPSIGSPVVMDLGRVDSGDVAVVSDFATWAVDNYPADRYAFVIWNHGWGWSLAPSEEPAIKKGISWDEDTNNDLSVAEGELAEVLDALTAATGAPLSLVGMDACVMGSWEVAYAAMPYGETYVASQDYEGSDGWAYDGMLDLLVADPAMDGASLGEAVAWTFNESGDSTQSVVDLAALEGLNTALDNLATALMASADPAGELKAGAAGSQDFEGGSGVDHDLGDFLSQLSSASADPAVVEAADAALIAYEAVILANYTNGRWVEDASGLSIYTPLRSGVDEVYLEGIWSEETLWDDFLSLARTRP